MCFLSFSSITVSTVRGFLVESPPSLSDPLIILCAMLPLLADLCCWALLGCAAFYTTQSVLVAASASSPNISLVALMHKLPRLRVFWIACVVLFSTVDVTISFWIFASNRLFLCFYLRLCYGLLFLASGLQVGFFGHRLWVIITRLTQLASSASSSHSSSPSSSRVPSFAFLSSISHRSKVERFHTHFLWFRTFYPAFSIGLLLISFCEFFFAFSSLPLDYNQPFVASGPSAVHAGHSYCLLFLFLNFIFRAFLLLLRLF